MPSQTSKPVVANFPSEKLTIGAGVAIFQLSTERVVVCYHTRERYWFLPKGRVNANEDARRAAEREGFEESGYRNRLLPLPMRHRQPEPDEGPQEFVAQPLWTQLAPVSSSSQYILFWYAAETVPEEVEASYSAANGGTVVEQPKRIYRPPASFPVNITLGERIAADTMIGPDGKAAMYEPIRHEGTGVDADELLYTSYLLPISEACHKLRGSVMADVIQRGWDGVKLRLQIEAERSSSRTAPAS